MVKVRSYDNPNNNNLNIIEVQIRFNYNLRKRLNLHKAYLTFKIWTTLRTSGMGLFNRLRFHTMYYIDNLGVISVNNVIRAIDYAIWTKYGHHIVSCESNYDIKFNLT